jgi:signal transduction histidine kinase
MARSIKAHADELSVNHPELTIKLDLVSDRNVISEEISLALFRIYQQSLANILRHADADEVNIVLALDGDAVSLEITDNGVGFDVPDQWISLVRAGHYGLAGTVDRVNSLGGEFRVDSAPGEGTRVFIQIPDYMET